MLLVSNHISEEVAYTSNRQWMFPINTTNDDAGNEYPYKQGIDLIVEKQRGEAKRGDEWDVYDGWNERERWIMKDRVPLNEWEWMVKEELGKEWNDEMEWIKGWGVEMGWVECDGSGGMGREWLEMNGDRALMWMGTEVANGWWWGWWSWNRKERRME